MDTWFLTRHKRIQKVLKKSRGYWLEELKLLITDMITTNADEMVWYGTFLTRFAHQIDVTMMAPAGVYYNMAVDDKKKSDPHIWLGYPQLKVMAKNIKDELITYYPKDKDKLIKNYNDFMNILDNMNKLNLKLFAHFKGKSVISMIFFREFNSVSLTIFYFILPESFK